MTCEEDSSTFLPCSKLLRSDLHFFYVETETALLQLRARLEGAAGRGMAMTAERAGAAAVRQGRTVAVAMTVGVRGRPRGAWWRAARLLPVAGLL